MDEISVKYYHDLFSTDILSGNLSVLTANNCYISETHILADLFMLLKQNSRSSLSPLSESVSKGPYSSLQVLSLVHNYLTDDCFRVLTKLSKVAISLKKIDLSYNRIKLCQ